MSGSAYAAGLKMLARRDLSEVQIRRRLARLGHGPDEIAAAVDDLKAAGGIDDARVAAAIARREALVRRRGPMRVEQQLAAAGITGALAEQAVAQAFQETDSDAVLTAAIEKRLAGQAIHDDRELARLYRHFMRQGFEHERVLRILRSKQAR